MYLKMPKITFIKENVTFEVPAGTKFIDAVSKAHANVIFGCEDGICGSCLLTIVKGMENLSGITEQEKQTLEMFCAEKNQRLGCQLIILGDVVIETV